MTSIPASRSARAMTLAPRSCPSRPGLAMTTRIFRMWFGPADPDATRSPQRRALGSVRLEPDLDQRDFLVFAPHLAERIAHLADGRIGADAIEQRIHRVGVRTGRTAERVERARDRVVVARAPQRLETRELRFGGRLVDVENRVRRLVVLDVVVDADDDLLPPLDRLLELVRRLGDLALREALLDGLDHPAHPVDDVEVVVRAALHVEGEPLEEVRPAERVDHVG